MGQREGLGTAIAFIVRRGSFGTLSCERARGGPANRLLEGDGLGPPLRETPKLETRSILRALPDKSTNFSVHCPWTHEGCVNYSEGLREFHRRGRSSGAWL